MRNRMSVLSRRLERFAVIFSIATFAFSLAGFFAASKTDSQLFFLSAGLAAGCLFAAFFLWLAHGFAWAMIPEEPVVARRPAETLKLSETMRTAEPMELAEPMKPVEKIRPAEAIKPAEPIKPQETIKPAETFKPVEALKPVETMKAVEKKPAEEKELVEEDPPDAKYTITGKRIY